MINATQGHASIEKKMPEAKQSSKALLNGSVFKIHNTQRRIRIDKEDEFSCFVDNDSYYTTEKYKLIYKGLINSVDSIENTELTNDELSENERRKEKKLKPLKYYDHFVEFSEVSSFHTYEYLDDYAYSLTKIYKRYINPIVHFRQSITELPKLDFETLQKERIYVSRTLFGRLINALPYENRLQFLLYSVEHFNESDLRKIPFSKAFPLLKEFVSTGIIQSGKHLIKSEELIKKHYLFNQENNIGFSYENEIESINKKETDFQIDNIFEQAELFRNTFEIDGDFDKLFSFDDLENNAADVKIFDKLFSKRAWPVDLNTEER